MTLARAFAFEVVTDNLGSVIQGATVTVRQPGTVTNITETMFSAASGGGTLSNPLTTDAQGIVKFWLAAPKTVDLLISAPGMASFTRQNVMVLPDLAAMILSEGTQTIAGPLAINGVAITNGTWAGGTLTAPAISSPTFSGTVSGMTLSANLVWGTGYAGVMTDSRENALSAGTLNTVGEAFFQAEAFQRGSSGMSAAANIPITNSQVYVAPTGAGTGFTHYSRVWRVNDAATLYALYSHTFHVIAYGNPTSYGGGSDNVAVAMIAENASGNHNRIWAAYPEIRTYSQLAAATAVEANLKQLSGAAAATPWAASPFMAYMAVVDAALNGGVAGSKYGSFGYGLFSQDGTQRSSWRTGFYVASNAMKKSGSDAALGVGTTEDTGAWLIHAAQMDASTRFALLQHAGALFAAENGWTTASGYGSDIPLIGTESGDNFTRVYGSTRAYISPSQGSSSPYARFSATDFTLPPVGIMGFANAAGLSTPDTYFSRDAAGVMAQRDGTNSQVFYLYNTSSSANANYERLGFLFSSNIAHILTYAGGTGTVRALRFGTGGTGQWEIATSGVFSSLTARRGQFKQPAARVYRSTNKTIPSGAWTAIEMDSERYDQDGNGGATLAMHSTDEFVYAPIAGVYLVTGHVYIPGGVSGAGTMRAVRLYHQGATPIAHSSVPATNSDVFLTVATVYKFAASDHVQLQAFQDSGNNTLAATVVANASPELTLTYLSD